MARTDTEVMRDRALADLRQRRELAFALPRIDNSKLYAGQPMVYYCKTCGWPSDIKHETWFLAGPKDYCGECQEMIVLGWLRSDDVWQPEELQQGNPTLPSPRPLLP